VYSSVTSITVYIIPVPHYRIMSVTHNKIVHHPPTNHCSPTHCTNLATNCYPEFHLTSTNHSLSLSLSQLNSIPTSSFFISINRLLTSDSHLLYTDLLSSISLLPLVTNCLYFLIQCSHALIHLLHSAAVS